MKRETLRHPKTHDLAARLGVSRPEALGYLLLLWDYTAEVAPRGDIGKWSNGVIARGCDWDGDPDEFVAALVAAHWLDESDEYRLVIHDLEHHAEQWWKQKVSKLNLTFAKARSPTAVTTAVGLTPTAVVTAVGPTQESVTVPPRDLTKPNLTKPNLTKPTSPSGDGACREPPLPSSEFDSWWKAYPRKVGRKAAKAAWERAVRKLAELTGTTPADAAAKLLETTERFAQTPKGRGEFCPHPTTWLNEGRYEDDPKEWQERRAGIRAGPGQTFLPDAGGGGDI